MRIQSSIQSNSIANTVLGQIITYDPVSFSAQVMLYAADPTDPTSVPLTTGYLPICVPTVGWYPAPNLNDLCLVHFQEASQQVGYISLFAYTGQPGQSVPSGEWWFFRPDGSYLKFTNDDKIAIHSTVEIDISAPVVNITATTANITATTANISGAVNLGDIMGTLTPLLTGAASSIYNSHTHTGAFTGPTSTPTPQLTSADQTTNVKAN
jgi:hypothetical protein